MVAVECVVLCRALESDSSMDSRNPGRAVAAVAVVGIVGYIPHPNPKHPHIPHSTLSAVAKCINFFF